MPPEPLKIAPPVEDIIRVIHENDSDAYIVGGAVRDLLLNITPKDYDIATSATPEQLKTFFGRQARIIGKRFRLVHVYQGRTYFEVSTFRREPSPEERCGRETDDGVMLWRDNQYGTLEQDANRRDFTVNALYYDPLRGSSEIIDFTGGLNDIKAGLVRAIGDPERRLAEDPVRILRALKLVAQYKFELESMLAEAVRQQVEAITTASRSRLYEEMLKIFHKPYMAATFTTFHQYRLLEHYLPHLDQLWSSRPGELTRQLLSERDRRILAGAYSNSRTLAIATLAVAPIMANLGVDTTEGIPEFEHGLHSTIQDSIRALFDPLPMPRFLSARARDVILLLPYFTDQGHQNRLMHHPEYMYARELFSLLTEVHGWDPAMIAEWPEKGHARPGHKRSGRSLRQKHVRRSHQKKWDEK